MRCEYLKSKQIGKNSYCPHCAKYDKPVFCPGDVKNCPEEKNFVGKGKNSERTAE